MAEATYPGTLRATSTPPYLVLLRSGFSLPTLLPAFAVRSYRTFSPLPFRHRSGGLRRYILCGTDP